jgi:hypothetical protein
MEAILSLIPPWALAIIILALIVFIFLILRKKNFSIKTKNIEISTNSENIYLVINKSIRVADEISEIKYRRRLNEQMSFCDDAMEAIRSILLRHFRELLDEKHVNNATASREYKIYEKIIHIMLMQMKSLCKSRFEEMLDIFDKDTNIHDTFDVIRFEFEVYKERIVSNILSRAASIITNEWIDNSIVSRQESEDHSQTVLPDISIKVGDVFQNAIETQLKYSKRIKELDTEIKNFIMSLGDKRG